MKNIAPAISPPAGFGDQDTSNKAVLDWVEEIAALTQPDPSIDTDLIEQALFVPPPPAHELLQPPRV